MQCNCKWNSLFTSFPSYQVSIFTHRNFQPIDQGCVKNSYLKKAIKFDKHLFTPELVSVLVYPCSHCRYQIGSPFLSPELQTLPLALINFITAASICVAANDRSNVQLSRSHSGHSKSELRNIFFFRCFFFLSFSLLLSLLSLSNFSLLSVSWETFTYPGICNQQLGGLICNFLKVSYN
jgi:hypothetical protein